MIEPKRSICHEIKNTKHCPESKENARLQANKSFFFFISVWDGMKDFKPNMKLVKKKKKGKKSAAANSTKSSQGAQWELDQHKGD